MSKEKEPEPERAVEPKEKIQSQCWNCEHNVRSSLANTTNHIYVKEPWHNQTRLKCLDEACGSVTLLFHDLINEKSLAIAMQYPTSILEFLDEEDDYESLMDIRARAVGAKDVETRQLSARQSTNIERWGEFLQKMVIDVSDFSSES